MAKKKIKQKKFRLKEEGLIKIFTKFVINEGDDFENFMGYGPDVIEQIGIRKFINMMGWTKPSDVSSWRTDKLHIVPCKHCGTKFGIYETAFGFCDDCCEIYDIEKMINDYVEESLKPDQTEEKLHELLVNIFNNEEFREKYKREK